jgi:putative CocE/NonD family hydrolase
LKRAINKVLYLHSNGEFVWKPFGGGTLSFNFPREREVPDEYDFNPIDPVITCGGTNLNLPKGIKNQKVAELREDTLIYTRPPLTRGMEVTGNVVFHLYAESNAEDTDFMIKLCDVSPLGKSINVLDLGIRARYRDLDYQNPKLIEPGKVYHYTIPLGPTSYYF